MNKIYFIYPIIAYILFTFGNYLLNEEDTMVNYCGTVSYIGTLLCIYLFVKGLFIKVKE